MPEPAQQPKSCTGVTKQNMLKLNMLRVSEETKAALGSSNVTNLSVNMAGELVVDPGEKNSPTRDGMSRGDTGLTSCESTEDSSSEDVPVGEYISNSPALSEFRQKEREAQVRFEQVWSKVSPDQENNVPTTPSTVGTEGFGIDSQEEDSVNAKKMVNQEDEKPSKCFKWICLGLFLIFLLAAAVGGPMLGKHFTQSITSKNAFVEYEVDTIEPSFSVAPSVGPTLSLLPSSSPSDVPSESPSTSLQPSDIPSFQPTASKAPSLRPSLSQGPSVTPSKQPSVSIQPSVVPTDKPSFQPSLSLSPTINPEWRFKLRLYWERGYFWQEETQERYWCVECTRCDEYGRGDGWEHGCERYGNSGKEDECRVGDSLWVMDCRDRGARFNILQVPGSGYVLRLDDTNLCIARRNKYLIVKKCDLEDYRQLWAPWSDWTKFELLPFESIGVSEREAFCVSQLHHPKAEEVIGMHNCRLSRIYETRYWEARY